MSTLDFKDGYFRTMWTANYQGIARCNLMLQKIEENKAKLSAASIKQYQGEVYFLRAFYYLKLTNIFGDVVYTDKPVSSVTDGKAVTRTPRADVLKKIYADFDMSAQLLTGSTVKTMGRVTAGAAMSWLVYEKIKGGKATTLGVASGAIAGAVVITPACGYINPIGALILGLIAGVVSNYAVSRKYKFGYDDSLDVVGVHGVSGIIGMIGIGLFATVTVNATGKEGLFINGSAALLSKQLIAIAAVATFSFCATWLIATLISRTIGFRVLRDDELTGLDTTYHAESAYDITGNSNRY